MTVEPSRVFHLAYIVLDIIFLLLLSGILLRARRRMALLIGLAGAVVYFLVDYGIFFQIMGTRVVTGADPFWLLLWLSASYGFTNFVWIWLWLDRDGHALEWSVLIVAGWLATALLGQSLGAGSPEITISRGTGMYHGFMAVVLFAGYAYLCVRNVMTRREKYPLPWILGIGLLVQFAWEFVLLITGIRAPEFGPVIVNSLLETNLGLPYLFLIHRALNSRWNEDLSRVNPPDYAPEPRHAD